MPELNDVLTEVKALGTNINKIKETGDATTTALAAANTTIGELKGKLEASEKEVKELKEWRVTKDEADKKNQDALNQLLIGGKSYKAIDAPKTFGEAFAEEVKEKFSEIKGVSKGRPFNTELKAVGNMTSATNLTPADAVIQTINPNPVIKPADLVNFRDIVGTFTSGTGQYVTYRETGSEGGIGLTSAGQTKSQIDYDFTKTVVNAVYIAGWVKIAKEMLQDLPFMQTVLPQMLLRDFYKKESTTFYADWVAAVPAAAAPSGANQIEKIITSIGALEDNNYGINGILVKPSLAAAISITKPQNYGLPGNVFMTPTGQLTINGVPVYKAPWVATNYADLGDWTQARIGVVDGLKVEFFEQDDKNVQQNLITVRVEAREFLAIDQIAGFNHTSVA